MSLTDILKLVGFATGAAIHLYISWLILQRRLGSRPALHMTERALLILGVCLGVWFLGNLLTSFHTLLIGQRLTAALRIWDTMTLIGVALIPSALLHAHLAFWSNTANLLGERALKAAAAAVYLPMILLPFPVYLINSGEYQPFFVRLEPFLIPYSVWFLAALWTGAALDWRLLKRLHPGATREREFFQLLALLLFVTGAFEFAVVGIRGSGPNDYLWVAYILLSLLPSVLAAYYVYRYRLVDIVIKSGIVYAGFALLFITVYSFGVNNLDQFLVDRYAIRPNVLEVILILGMVALAGPLVRLLDRMVHRLFQREFGAYRDVVRQVSSGASSFGELRSLMTYTEDAIRTGLDLNRVKLLLRDSDTAEPTITRLAEADRGADMIELEAGAYWSEPATALAMRREGRLVGMMVVASDPQGLTSEKRAILDALAGHVAVELERCTLVEEKVRLERELASRERLATLGQMAATVAHEVKNPLSSIKSIAQVMREELGPDYDRDLSLIVSEIDRLNRTVSQLLAFSRPARSETATVQLSGLIETTVELFRNDAREGGVSLNIGALPEIHIDGRVSSAMRDALGNLILNGIQATPEGGEVLIEAVIDEAGRRESPLSLRVAVVDTGPGIARDEQMRVFEPFYTTRSRGTGLGLAIVQRRVGEVGGSIELMSPVRDGHGSKFTITIPVSLDQPALRSGSTGLVVS